MENEEIVFSVLVVIENGGADAGGLDEELFVVDCAVNDGGTERPGLADIGEGNPGWGQGEEQEGA